MTNGNMGDRVTAKVREQLAGLIADDELEAMIDREVMQIRASMTSKVHAEAIKIVGAVIESKLSAWLKTATAETWAAGVVQKIVDEIAENAKKVIFGEKNGSDVHWAWSSLNGIRESLDKLMRNKVYGRIVERWGEDGRINDIANDAAEKLVPQAMSLFIQDATRRVMGVMRPEMEIRAGIESGRLRACPKCYAVWDTSGKEKHDHRCGQPARDQFGNFA